MSVYIYMYYPDHTCVCIYIYMDVNVYERCGVYTKAHTSHRNSASTFRAMKFEVAFHCVCDMTMCAYIYIHIYIYIYMNIVTTHQTKKSIVVYMSHKCACI